MALVLSWFPTKYFYYATISYHITDCHLHAVRCANHFWYFPFFIPQGPAGVCTPIPGGWYYLGIYSGRCLYSSWAFVFNKSVCKVYQLPAGGNADIFYPDDPLAQLYECRRQGYAANGPY